jgi:colanic acid biosynthesis glycosyl transferase WcaI
LILRRFNRVSTISEPMRRSLIMKGVAPDRTRLLPNWTDLTSIRPFDSTSPLRAELGIPADTVVALYAGTLGEKQGLEILAEVASRLESPPEMVIAVAGDGPGRTRLAEAAASSPRLRLLPLQPIERLNDLLNLADMHLLPERVEAADLVMPSKLGGMLASGRPVIAAVRPDGAIATAVADAGIVVPPGDAAAIATAIVQLARDPARRSGLGRAARRIAERNWDRDAILQRFEKELLILIR